jgi:hypothetical protein
MLEPIESEQQTPEKKNGGARPGAGRPLGSKNTSKTHEIREALFAAAENSHHRKGSLMTYLTYIADEYPGLYCSLLGKFIPHQISTRNEATLSVIYHDVAEVKKAMADSGFAPTQIEQLQALLPVDDNILDVEANEVTHEQRDEDDTR